MMEVLAVQRQPPEAMLKSLSSYLANSQIMDLMGEKNLAKFRHLLLILKFWAKSNHIYGNVFGFFNGISLSILASKIILFYPNASLPFLFEKSVLILTIWNWPIPMQLTEGPGRMFARFSWHPFEIYSSTMPIITPSILTQNSSFNINSSTFKIIQRELEKGYSQVRKVQNLPESSLKMDEWRKLFPVDNFTEKYHHFVVISCVVSARVHIDQFCGFAERKVRLQLQQIDQTMEHIVEYSHVKPDPNLAKNNECPKRFYNETFRNPFCKIWLVGLKLKNGLFADNRHLGIELRQNLKQIFRKELDTKIYKEYDVKVLRGWYQLIKLESEYAEVEELKEWNIGGNETQSKIPEGNI